MKFFFLLLQVVPSYVFSQFCPNVAIPPTTVNGIFVTDTFTGSVITPYSTPTITLCDVFNSPNTVVYLGAGSPLTDFSYTINFNFPVNNLDFILFGGGGGFDSTLTYEEFTFTTNAGVPSIIDQGSCFTSINNNVVTQGGTPGVSRAGAGNFTLVNLNPFTSLNIAGPARLLGGTFFALCSSSINTRIDEVEEICAGDSVFIDGKYRTEQGLYADTILGGSSNGNDTVIVTNLIVNSIALDLGNDTNLCQGDTLLLNAFTNNASYLWQDNTEDAALNVFAPGTYWVQITVDACTAADTIEVIRNNECEVLLEMPNIFTPNNDGINDLFLPIISKGITFMQLKIYNRWGEKLAENSGNSVEWNGKDVVDGVYFWIIDFETVNGDSNNAKGTLTLLR